MISQPWTKHSMPSKLHIFTGNHLEILAEALSRKIAEPLAGNATADALQPEVVLVQSKGMQRWLSMTIARHNGICANMQFPFPNTFIEQTSERVLGTLLQENPFEPLTLTFRIMGLIDELMALKPFGAIRGYISGPGQPLKLFQLSSKIADVFDQYLVFRPELIQSWETEATNPPAHGSDWQSILWAKLVEKSETPHRAALQSRLIHRLRQSTHPISNLPGRISVFGISHLPPFHLEVLDALANRIPVNIFLFNPCRQFWSDIVSEHRLIKERSKIRDDNTAFDDFHFERGNRLLSSWGHQGRQFFSLIHQMDGQSIELFSENKTDTLLGLIQQDILELNDRPTTAVDRKPHLPDHSLRIHACHSPMREVEVLYDQLLDILDSNRSIDPAEILIMTPDIATYAPLIHAIFSGALDGRSGQIPYTVADQNIPRESRVVQAFLHLLTLRDSRFEVSNILALLEFSCIRRRFGFQEADIPLLENWIADVNIRWGWNSKDRRRHGLPGFEDNTWRQGLDRLLLGYAVKMENNTLFAGLLPHQNGIEGNDSRILGQFVFFAETLYHKISRMPETESLKGWTPFLGDLIDVFFEDSDRYANDLQLLRAVFEKMGRISDSIDRPVDIDFDVVHQFIKKTLERASYGGGFMAGAVTFCAMLPMRSIPAKVIGILGMQHDAFPRQDHEPEFNLMTESPKPGDRSKRYDDKYLFLEALLSARQIFYLSYVGRDIQDNAPKPPSVLVSELLEYIHGGFGIPESLMVIQQPLQAFSPQYFAGVTNGLFSYSEENCQAASHLNLNEGRRPFFSSGLPAPEMDFYDLTFSLLLEYFSHPSKFLLEKRLGITPLATPQLLEDRESFDLNGLQQFLVRQDIFKAQSRKMSPESGYSLQHATGNLPHGTFGRAVYDQLVHDVAIFTRKIGKYTDSDAPQRVPFSFSVPPYRVSGHLDGIYPTERIASRLARIRPQDLLHCYLHHLAMNYLDDGTVPRQSILICMDQTWRFDPVDNPQEVLANYLDLYWRGLQFPLPFFPLSSFTYAHQRIVLQKDPQKALSAALRQWHGGYSHPGEGSDPHLELVFGTENPITPDFEKLAMQVFTPLFDAGHPLSADA